VGFGWLLMSGLWFAGVVADKMGCGGFGFACVGVGVMGGCRG
jgi:hypothetical protein